ncbi:response regulator transcription factor [Deinococcus sonorensis]|uniref:Response regulator transcription factor n=2 Tax=Deinococcus sonorensis TaxID=309891 RepID=A0AAU7UHD7_9DEIO
MATRAASGSFPTVQVAVGSGLLRAGLQALLTQAGVPLVLSGGEVLLIDDSWLPDPALAGTPGGVVALGSVVWASLLPELVVGGWAALPADPAPAELLAAVLGAAAGLAVLPAALARRLDSEPDDEPLELPLEEVSLTPREREVLRLLAEGLSNKRLARALGVAESTVKFHVQAVYSKLEVASRTAAVTRGIQLGLVSV